MDSNGTQAQYSTRHLTLIVSLTLLANAVIVGFVYYYHSLQLEESARRYQSLIAEREKEAGKLKEEIRTLEGVSSWASTTFQTVYSSDDTAE